MTKNKVVLGEYLESECEIKKIVEREKREKEESEKRKKRRRKREKKRSGKSRLKNMRNSCTVIFADLFNANYFRCFSSAFV